MSFEGSDDCKVEMVFDYDKNIDYYYYVVSNSKSDDEAEESFFKQQIKEKIEVTPRKH